ncbi:MAG: preprotein translocase subunit SecE [Bacteroidota bacterium]|nr:preprotein translocase subunit SecE [Bacteroidota bacterium]MDE2834868.1 preprotein translocase subunit SecE [Bacteroidota bacterium]MDE2957319.1 preprotein translocase subunit SecE [Bacteroidota bacterium]
MKKLAMKARNYVDEVSTEIRKASWPRRKELVSHTIVTLVASVALALFIFGADRVISYILDIIYPG